MFLVCKEVSPELNIDFFPYQFGPYSNQVAYECNWLVEKDCIIGKKVGRTWNLSITELGKSKITQEKLTNYDKAQFEVKLNQIARIKKSAQELGLKKTTEFLKSHYPAYFKNSRF
jgi:uncharacterized protein YwgA